MPVRSALLAASLLAASLLVAGTAGAVEQLPIIVTYEMQRQSEAAHEARADPKAFWIRQIVARIEDKKPASSLGLRQPAVARVSFVVARDGRLASRTVERSSGVPAVDAEALAMLDRAQPFPPMPPSMGDAELAFALPLRFR